MEEKALIENIVSEILKLGHEPSTKELSKILRNNPKPEGGFYSKAEIIDKYTQIVGNSHGFDKLTTGGHSLPQIRKLLRMKPTRTISGVAPITIFTKPYPCPGKCIFCPTQKDMPKSYLREEPGAMRAEKLKFDPFVQTTKRIEALENIGHNTDKVEIIISGGTWNHYEKDYREWYVTEVFRALNSPPEKRGKSQSDMGVIEKRANPPSPSLIPRNCGASREELEQLKKQNETAKHRCVGLTIETRPDYINEEEIIHLRKLGVTKVQLGVQSLNDTVLTKNQRGHTADDSRNAINLLRLAGFKIHIHWMANLYGSTVEKDYVDFGRLFKDPSIMPDELKVYPCSVVGNTILKDLMDKGEFRPYEEKELIDLLVKCKSLVPEYCRITRLFRDIPSQLIKGGTTKTNLRQIVLAEMERKGIHCNCIRCREIKNEKFDTENIRQEMYEYQTSTSKEFFLSFLTINNKQSTTNNCLLGFLRLSLPNKELSENHFIEELKSSAIIREVHVYGRSLNLEAPMPAPHLRGIRGVKETQHMGLGKKLIEKAKEIAKENQYEKLAVISAVGTREYYRKRGFEDGEMYQHIRL